MNSWFIFAVMSLFALSGSELSQKISLSQKAKISAITNNFFVWSLQGLGGLILATILGQVSFSLDLNQWLRLLAVAVMYFLGGTFYYSSFRTNSPSVSIIMGSISVVVSTTLGIVFFGESTYWIKFLGIALIMISIVIINFQRGLKIEKNNFFALAGGLCYGVSYTLDKSFALQIHPIMYVSLMCFSVAVVSLVVGHRLIYKELRTLAPKNFIPMLSSSFFGTSFNSLTFLSYNKGGNVGVVDAINNSAVFVVILFEMLIMRDYSDLKKKIISSVMVVLGMAMLSMII